MKFISFDPGGTTGIAILDSKHPTKIRTIQLSNKDHYMGLWSMLIVTEPDIIICESFDYRIMADNEQKDQGRLGIELISRNYIGVIELYSRLYNRKLEMQMPMEAVGRKPFWDNEKLKRMGIYVNGAPHANDAVRHLLYYLVFKQKIKTYLTYLREDCSLPPLSVEYNLVGQDNRSTIQSQDIF